jgi:phosphatidate cytidylyltransferase
MNNFFERSLLFFIGLPFLIFIIVYFDRFSHLGWIIVVILATAVGSHESLKLFTGAGEGAKRGDALLIPALASLLLLSAAVDTLYSPSLNAFLPALAVEVTVIFLIALHEWDSKRPEGFVGRSGSLILSIVYPALFMSFLIRFAEFPSALQVMLLFLILNFANDTFSYIAGRIFGSRSKRLFAVSPNKTLVGYIGGFTGSLLLGSLFAFFFPEIFSASWSLRLLFFFLTALFADMGDLVESAFKREAGKKDSGSFIPGRGGMLDSIDSLLFSAPFFYYSGMIIFG